MLDKKVKFFIDKKIDIKSTNRRDHNALITAIIY